MERIKNLVSKSFSKFLIIGSFNTLVDIILYSILTDLVGLNIIYSNIISTSLTLIMSFYLNHYFVFNSEKKKLSTAWKFVIITLFNVWGIQSLIIYISNHELLKANLLINHRWTINLLAKLCGVTVSFMLNYLGYKYVFRLSKEKLFIG
jgi:putative flippase GtrA